MVYKKSLGLPREAQRAKWGQHFLKDPRILKKIADFARIEKGDTVVEIGPGEGTLTKFLLEQAERVIAIEKDEALAQKLKEKFREQIQDSIFKILEDDVLKIENLMKIAKLKIENYVLVGNIPYYITGAIFKKFLESDNQPKSITFVVQKEVADRILARDKKESILSISIKAYGTPEYGGIIKAGSFSPKPKVDSAIISIRDISKEKFVEACSEKSPGPLKKKMPLWDRSAFRRNMPRKNFDFEKRFEGATHPASLTLREELEEKFFHILKMGFAHKRKYLINNLGVDKEIFKKCGLAEKARAEDLAVEDWLCLAKLDILKE